MQNSELYSKNLDSKRETKLADLELTNRTRTAETGSSLFDNYCKFVV